MAKAFGQEADMDYSLMDDPYEDMSLEELESMIDAQAADEEDRYQQDGE